MDVLPEVKNACPGVLVGAPSEVFMTLIGALMSAMCKFDTKHIYPNDYAPYVQDGEQFDFIIVGAGSAGSLLANRLSKVSQWNVLVIEAGGYPSATSEIPGMFGTLRDTQEDWAYTMEKSNSYCAGLKGNACPCPRGKGLGGSSLINVMLYVRSTKHDHADWVDQGNIGWDHDVVMKHYEMFEKIPGSKTGNLQISQSVPQSFILRSFQDAYEELGFPLYTEETPIGFNAPLMTIAQGTRQNSAKAFLSPAKNRENLRVLLNSQVSRLLYDEDKQKVIGVEVKTKDGHILKLYTKKEVVLSAGSINSPQILMASGIGPKQHLSKHGIKVVRDLQVGENLQDHVVFPSFFVEVASTDLQMAKSPKYLLDDTYEYLMRKTGPLAWLNSTANGFISTKNFRNQSDIQLVHLVFHKQSSELLGVLDHFLIPDSVREQVTKVNERSGVISIMQIMLKPKSRGRVELRSKDPFSSPMIIPNFFGDTHNEDIKTMVNSIKQVKRLIQTKAFSRFSPKVVEFDIPNCQRTRKDSDEYWKCIVTNLGQTLFHPVGTCKMGPESDEFAVIDPRLRLYGIRGVRVVDGSVMPTITSSNTNAPITMIAEMGARFIIEEWQHHIDEL